MRLSRIAQIISATAVSFPRTITAILTDWEQIHQTLHLYPLIVDRHRFDLLPQLFTEDASTNYTGFQPDAVGLDNIRIGLEAAVSTITSQHLLGTTLIDIAEDRKTANSTVYVLGTLFAFPQETPGQVVYVHGYYADHLVKTDEGWRINERVFSLQPPGLAGNLTLLGR